MPATINSAGPTSFGLTVLGSDRRWLRSVVRELGPQTVVPKCLWVRRAIIESSATFRGRSYVPFAWDYSSEEATVACPSCGGNIVLVRGYLPRRHEVVCHVGGSTFNIRVWMGWSPCCDSRAWSAAIMSRQVAKPIEVMSAAQALDLAVRSDDVAGLNFGREDSRRLLVEAAGAAPQGGEQARRRVQWGTIGDSVSPMDDLRRSRDALAVAGFFASATQVMEPVGQRGAVRRNRIREVAAMTETEANFNAVSTISAIANAAAAGELGDTEPEAVSLINRWARQSGMIGDRAELVRAFLSRLASPLAPLSDHHAEQLRRLATQSWIVSDTRRVIEAAVGDPPLRERRAAQSGEASPAEPAEPAREQEPRSRHDWVAATDSWGPLAERLQNQVNVRLRTRDVIRQASRMGSGLSDGLAAEVISLIVDACAAGDAREMYEEARSMLDMLCRRSCPIDRQAYLALNYLVCSTVPPESLAAHQVCILGDLATSAWISGAARRAVTNLLLRCAAGEGCERTRAATSALLRIGVCNYGGNRLGNWPPF